MENHALHHPSPVLGRAAHIVYGLYLGRGRPRRLPRQLGEQERVEAPVGSADRGTIHDAGRLRKELLGINGVGPETADSILLYALEMRIFVVDAYTVRIFGRLGILDGTEGYDEVQRLFHRRFAAGVREYNEYHALIVNHGKYVCRKKPLCAECCLARHCAFEG